MWLQQTSHKEHKISGIYQLKINEESFYIGSSCNIHKRFIDHRYELSTCTHTNGKLQNSYNKHNNLEVRILATCPKEYLIKLEQWFLDNYEGGSNLNIVKVAGSNYKPTTKESTKEKLSKIRKGRVFSAETRQRISESKKGEKNAMFGIKQSQETIEKRVQKLKGKKRSNEDSVRKVINRKNRKEFFLYLNGKLYYCFNIRSLTQKIGLNMEDIYSIINKKIRTRKDFKVLENQSKILTEDFYTAHKEHIINIRPDDYLNDFIIDNYLTEELKNDLMNQEYLKMKSSKVKSKSLLTQQDIIRQFQSTHDDFYRYDKFIFTNKTTKSIITCSIHGDFLQTPFDHLSGRGCSKCGSEKASKKKYKKVIVEGDSFKKIFSSSDECAKYFNLNGSTIRKYIRHKSMYKSMNFKFYINE